MAKGQYLSSHQQGIVKRYYEHQETILANKLGEIVSDLYLCTDAKKADRLWDRARQALAKTDADPGRTATMIAQRDLEALAKLTGVLALGGTKKSTPPTTQPSAAAPPPRTTTGAEPTTSGGGQSQATPSPAEIDPKELKMALKAFKKRLKLTRLDEESGLGRSPLTGGKRSSIVAITPPQQYPKAVWQELVRQGKLRSSGPGCYELVDG